MNSDRDPKNKPAAGAKPPETRDQRLKAALKANMARRKAQARARAEKHAEKTGRNTE